ncbi:TIR-like protein FxsC [Plantactinospora sp. WMMB334]|uniref:TIR-like protein FxsC n=1 Tax=Plantactinospora sp. WMMB334 TaxID=3404119 RepID=UPI003B95D88F
MGGRVLVFFLSYARGDDDPYVERFFRDLSSELRARLGLPPGEEVGFLDSHGIQLGTPWSSQLAVALAEARTFVALLSPRYLASEMCGMEWQAFSERMRRRDQAGGYPAAVLFPILWLPPRVIPPAVEQLQYLEEHLPDAYRRDGLRQLLRLHRHQDGYLEFLGFLSDRIAEAYERQPLPPEPHPIDFLHVRSAFHSRPAGTVDDVRSASFDLAPGERWPAERPDRVRFVVVAPTRSEAAAVRKRLDGYGPSPADWTPYLPASPEPIGATALAVARRHGFESRMDRAEELSEEPRKHDREMVILLVDPWATQLPSYRRILARYSEREPGWSGGLTVLIPRNHQDPETQAYARDLSDSVRSVFASQVVLGDDLSFRPSILSPAAFEEELRVVLEAARARSAGAGPGLRFPVTQRPIVEGP